MIIVDLIIKNGTCVTHKKIFKADIAIKKGKILKIGILDKFKTKKTIKIKNKFLNTTSSMFKNYSFMVFFSFKDL